MKTEDTKAYNLLRLENGEVLKEFEMVKLKGGTNIPLNSNNYSCANSNCNDNCCAGINGANIISPNHVTTKATFNH